MGFSKKLRRQRFLKKREEFGEATGSKMMMFDRLPDKCTICGRPFNKKSREHVQTWHVVARAEQKTVSLFCPECINTTNAELEPVLKNAVATEMKDGVLEVQVEPHDVTEVSIATPNLIEMNTFNMPVEEVPVEMPTDLIINATDEDIARRRVELAEAANADAEDLAYFKKNLFEALKIPADYVAEAPIEATR